ncbi:MAG: winged helix DNA-binding protein, partial [Candidatus Heimdallarchaeota archaeon]|nr:winged helix DNA-binding protein [Candidatus Heimdallarchaeota archaeon]
QVTNIRIIDINEIIVFEDFYVKNNKNTTATEILFWLNQTIKQVEIEDDLGNLDWSVITDYYSTNLITVNLRNSLEGGQITNFRVIYALDIDVKIIDDGNNSYYSFEYEYTNSYYTETYELVVRLPRSCFIHIEDPFSIYPNTFPPIVSGDYVSITWVLENITLASNQAFWVRFNDPPGNPVPIWVYIVSPTLGLTIGGIAVFWLMRKRQKKAMKKMGKIFLSKDQKLLLNLIYENDGKISQQQLINLTNFTKSKISRNLTPLLSFGLIEKEKWGREYRVFLTEIGKKMIK